MRRIDRRGIDHHGRARARRGRALGRPAGRYLAIASIEGWVYRLRASVRARSSGWPATGPTGASGDGGPAVDAELNGPHDVTYDADGQPAHRESPASAASMPPPGDRHGLRAARRSRSSSRPRGTFYLLTGDPNGGTVTQVDATGTVLQRDRHGQAGRHADRVPIGRVGFLPSDVEPVAGRS